MPRKLSLIHSSDCGGVNQEVIHSLQRFIFCSDVTSIGFSSLQVISADLDVNTGLYNISMALTDLQVEGIYSLTGSHHLIYPIIGTGPFDITLYGVSTSGTSKLYIKGKQAFNFVWQKKAEIDIKFCYSDFFQSYFE